VSAQGARSFRAAFCPLPIASSLLLDYPPRLAAVLPGVIARGPAHDAGGAPCLYLTFDDGPDPDGTPALLELLDAHDTRATFFLLGQRAARHPALVRTVADAGHGVGSHGWDHRDPWRTPGREVLDGLDRTEAVLSDLVGGRVRDHRPPYGRLTPATLRWARSAGRRIVLWDRMAGDFGKTAGKVRSLRPGSILVLHEGEAGRAARPRLLPPLLAALRADGWCFPAL